MAGSYAHCTNDDGTFCDEDFSGMIENLGDAHEACHQMHWMIEFLAQGNRDEINKAVEAYYEHMRSGGTL